jgi:hypothetical protein
MNSLIKDMELDGFMEYLLGLANDYVHHFDTIEDAYSYYIHEVLPEEDKSGYKLK